MKLWRDGDIDPQPLQGKKIAVIGYGAQGHAHALNLRDQGHDVVVGLRDGSASAGKAQAAGLATLPVIDAAQSADIVAMLLPDEQMAPAWADGLGQALTPGKTLLFAHGLAMHFGVIAAPPQVDVVMVAPKGPGARLRADFVAGSGLPAIFAVHQDCSGAAPALARAYASAIGCGRIGVIETTFKEECECDLFGEQAVLCGGIPDLMRAGFETLVAAGFSPEMAYFECVFEAKAVVDLIYARGIAGMYTAISNTAEFGAYRSGSRIIDEHVRAAMRQTLADIQSGAFAQAWTGDAARGFTAFSAARALRADSAIETPGRAIRALVEKD